MDKRPIGIFDSGLGGLTAVSALHALMPEENIIYFGDTARNPYGTRSVPQLRVLCREDMAFLQQFHVKAMIAACGTMSANVPELLQACEVHVENVLEPSVECMSKVSGTGPVAVIATEASIRSGAFQKRLHILCPEREILAIPCQDFVKLCETGHTGPDDALLVETVERYLKPVKEAEADALLLGCTHFGLIAEAIRNYLGIGTELISASECAAKEMQKYLTARDMTGGEGIIEYYTSGDPAEFDTGAGNFLGKSVKAHRGCAGEI